MGARSVPAVGLEDGTVDEGREDARSTRGSSTAEFGVTVGVLAAGVVAAAIAMGGATADQLEDSSQCIDDPVSACDEDHL